MTSLRARAVLFGWVSLWAAMAPSAPAATIIDTGVSCPASPNYCPQFSPLSPDDPRLAGRFTVTTPSRITSLEAYMLGPDPAPVTMTMAIYGNANGPAGSVPDSSIEYFAGQFAIADHPGAPKDDFLDQWQGLHDLDVLLQPGIYWLALEVRPGDTLTLNGVFTKSPEGYGPIFPADAYASAPQSPGIGWTPTNGPYDPWAFRIFAPEPASSALIALALAALGLRSRSCIRRDR